ncbi:MAG: hypothetical protein ACTSUV_00065 [Candidatus Ranarchaeia archaeon]
MTNNKIKNKEIPVYDEFQLLAVDGSYPPETNNLGNQGNILEILNEMLLKAVM